jgi:hypothetical protein
VKKKHGDEGVTIVPFFFSSFLQDRAGRGDNVSSLMAI